MLEGENKVQRRLQNISKEFQYNQTQNKLDSMKIAIFNNPAE